MTSSTDNPSDSPETRPGSDPTDGAAVSSGTGIATGETSRDFGFTKEDRIRTPKEFSQVFRQGRRRKGATLEFIWKPGDGDRTRLGLVVSRKSGGAVKRNRIKRLTREVFRRNRHRFPRPIDLVIRAYPRKEPIPDYAGIEKDFLDLADMLTRDRKKAPSTSNVPNRSHR